MLSFSISHWDLIKFPYFSDTTQGFFKRVLWCSSQGGDHPETILATSFFIPDMKVEKTQDLSIFLATYWTYCKIYGDLKFFSFLNLPNLDHFSQWKILCSGRNHIFQVEPLQKLANKKNTDTTDFYISLCHWHFEMHI
jgi:hypothetical protein